MALYSENRGMQPEAGDTYCVLYHEEPIPVSGYTGNANSYHDIVVSNTYNERLDFVMKSLMWIVTKTLRFRYYSLVGSVCDLWLRSFQLNSYPDRYILIHFGMYFD